MTEKPIFIHINKNAGTSIIATAGDNIVVAGHQPASRWVTGDTSKALLFAVIRNPYTRVFSEYDYRRNRFLSGEINAHLANLDLPFKEWVVSTFRDGVFNTRPYFEQSRTPYRKYRMIGDQLIWFISQTRWLCDSEGTMIVGETLRYESLDADWMDFSKRFGFECRLQQHNRSSDKAEPMRHFDKATRDLVYEYYREDFDRFGYHY